METSIDCCSICLETMDESETPLTQCSHRFHTTCLQRWNKNSCPNCRRRLTAESTDQREMNTIELNTRELNTREISMREINIIQALNLSYNYNYYHDNMINYNHSRYNTLDNINYHDNMINYNHSRYNTLNDMINHHHNGRVVTVRYGTPDPIVRTDRN